MNFERLRWLLIAAFMIVSLVPLAVLGFKVITQGQNLIEEKVSSYLKGLSHRNAEEIQDFMAERVNDIKSLSNMICIFGFDEKKLEQHFDQLKDPYSYYIGFFVTDRSGTVRFTTPNTATMDLPALLTDRIKTPGSLSDAGISKIFMFDDGRNRGPAMMIYAPVRNTSPEHCSHLYGILDFRRVDSLLRKSNIEKTGEVYLVDEKGRFLSASRFGAKALEDSISMAEVREKKQGLYETTDYRGERVLQAFQKLEKFSWYVMADQDMAEILGRIKKLGQEALLYGVLTALTVFCLAFFISKVIVNILKAKYKYEKELEFQVIQKEKLASLGLMTSGLAHELNTPLANALLYTQIAKEELEDGQTSIKTVQERLSTVVDEVRHGSRIIRNLLDFSRHSKNDGNKTHINETLNKLMAIAGPHCESNKIQVKMVLEKEMPPVAADASTVQAVLTNLVSNAIEAMPDGGDLQIKTRYIDVSKIIKIEIRDSGPGIPSQMLGEIFTPFFTTKKPGSGTGLGLFISHEMVRKLGGDLKVVSSTSQESAQSGSLFTVEFPIE